MPYLLRILEVELRRPKGITTDLEQSYASELGSGSLLAGSDEKNFPALSEHHRQPSLYSAKPRSQDFHGTQVEADVDSDSENALKQDTLEQSSLTQSGSNRPLFMILGTLAGVLMIIAFGLISACIWYHLRDPRYKRQG
ncbi:unnamed protein product [Protopolystoma xenopodis]|uniref:Uncharacterized protein n=1 Tax=Protopolystoma xenopodis TaxID=117903 RepID=A0A448X545_9PLAT|nr:unnamed protein product [Protopolystoma xenopodis]